VHRQAVDPKLPNFQAGLPRTTQARLILVHLEILAESATRLYFFFQTLVTFAHEFLIFG
jgi:hypothetical protein